MASRCYEEAGAPSRQQSAPRWLAPRSASGPSTPRTLEWYLATGEWRGRSGAYAIQGAGSQLVVGLEGEQENVVGLPLQTLRELYPELLLRANDHSRCCRAAEDDVR